MKMFQKIMIVLIVVLASNTFLYWMSPFDVNHWSNQVWSLTCACVLGCIAWYSLSVSKPGCIVASITGALTLGSVGFAAGFFGPIIFSPSSNQGPLLGIFITGPLGFLVGGIFGPIFWSFRQRKVSSIPEVEEPCCVPDDPDEPGSSEPGLLF